MQNKISTSYHNKAICRRSKYLHPRFGEGIFLIFIDLNIRLRIKYLKLLQKENDNDWSFVQNSAICSSRYIASRTRILIKKVWVNLRGTKQRKKVRFTTAFGGARGGANRCSKHLHLERAFFTDSQHFTEHQNGFGFLHLSN